MKLAAVILVGGASSRMGEDKAAQLWGDRRAVDRVADAARGAGANWIFTAGGDYGLPFVSDPFPQAGPVAGVLAALARLRAEGADRLLLMAVDAALVRAEDLRDLVDAPPPGAVYARFPLPAAIDIDSIAADGEGTWPLRRLAERAGLAVLPCDPDRAGRLKGANTPEERAVLLKDAWLDQG